MAKIIPLFKTVKKTLLPMTASMLKTLKMACNMQKNQQPIGQIDLNGSFMALLNREYIDSKNVVVFGETQVNWFVTLAGIDAMAKVGLKC